MEIPTIQPYDNFESAVQGVLDFLHQRLGFQLWMFTRVEGNDWVVLQANDHGYGVHTGDVFNWSDSFCSRMTKGLGPKIAPNSDQVKVYVNSPIGKAVPIKAYIGIPICNRDGELFGTLCAIDPQPQSEELYRERELINLLAKLLTTILYNQLEAEKNARLYERAEMEAQIDSLTGIYNRRGWDNLTKSEEIRCQRYGQTMSVIIVDLDDFKTINDTYGHQKGDLTLQYTAKYLRESVRDEDIVARIGGDEFALLLLEVTDEETREVAQRIQVNLHQCKIKASVGWARRTAHTNLEETIALADKRMYDKKMRYKREYD